MALCLAAGLDGIKRGLTPPEPIDYNVFDLSHKDLDKASVESLPASLEEAIKAAEADPLIREALGDHVYNNYIEGKKREWKEYSIQVTKWETDRYMRNH